MRTLNIFDHSLDESRSFYGGQNFLLPSFTTSTHILDLIQKSTMRPTDSISLALGPDYLGPTGLRLAHLHHRNHLLGEELAAALKELAAAQAAVAAENELIEAAWARVVHRGLECVCSSFSLVQSLILIDSSYWAFLNAAPVRGKIRKSV